MANSEADSHRPKDFWDVLSSLGTPIVALVVGVGAFSVNQSLKDRDVRVRMVELAIEILKSDRTETTANPQLREWAADLVNRYSGVPLRTEPSADAAVALTTKATAASFAGYAHVSITSEPPGALVWFTPNEYPEVSIPAPTPTPTEMNLLAGAYHLTFRLGDMEQKSSVLVAYNRENEITRKMN